jgi:hypothetical protein
MLPGPPYQPASASFSLYFQGGEEGSYSQISFLWYGPKPSSCCVSPSFFVFFSHLPFFGLTPLYWQQQEC